MLGLISNALTSGGGGGSTYDYLEIIDSLQNKHIEPINDGWNVRIKVGGVPFTSSNMTYRYPISLENPEEIYFKSRYAYMFVCVYLNDTIKWITYISPRYPLYQYNTRYTYYDSGSNRYYPCIYEETANLDSVTFLPYDVGDGETYINRYDQNTGSVSLQYRERYITHQKVVYEGTTLFDGDLERGANVSHGSLLSSSYNDISDADRLAFVKACHKWGVEHPDKVIN